MNEINHMHVNRLIYEKARRLHQAGQLDAADNLYLGLLPAGGDVFPVLNALALLRFQQSRFDDVIRFCNQAFKVNPSAASVLLLEASAYVNLGDFERALACWDRAVELVPSRAFLWKGRGDLLLHMGRFESAAANYEQALKLDPDNVVILTNYGFVLRRMRRPFDALAVYDRVIFHAAADATAFYNRGHILMDLGRHDEALLDYERALGHNPDFAEAVLSRGVALRLLGRLEDALQAYDRALAVRQDYAEAHFNRGVVLAALGERDEEIKCYERAIAINPEYAEAQLNKGLALLAKGDFASGLPLYEWRWQLVEPSERKGADVQLPLDASKFARRRLLVQAEQGLGDTLMFSRFAQMAAAKGIDVTLVVQDRLVRLLKGLDPAVPIAAASETIPPHDLRIPLLSMPLAFGTTLSSIPSALIYLRPENTLVTRWARQLGKTGFKIGVAWQGRNAREAGAKSFHPEYLRGISQLPGVRLISLQKMDGAELSVFAADGVPVEKPGDDFDSRSDAFVDTAGIIQNLDLIITCDTAIAHLAGAVGRPVWLALPFSPDWRWFLGRSDSPWYPSMRLFRQQTPRDWASVFAAMERDLVTSLMGPKPG